MSGDPDVLPAGWAWATIGGLAIYVQRGKSPKYTAERALPVINQKCIRWDRILTQHLKFVHRDQWDAWAPVRTLVNGDLLWNSTGTGTLGRAAIFEGIAGYQRVVVDSHVTVIRLAGYLPKLLHSWIRSPKIQQRLEKMQVGSTNQVELPKSEVVMMPLPVPPFKEQRRIVAKVETLQERSQRARSALEGISPLFDKFRQSVLAAAFRGDLTADWRAKNPDVEPASVLLERIRVERRKRWEQAELAKMEAKGKVPKNDKWKSKYKEPGPATMVWPDTPKSWAACSVGELIEGFEAGRNLKARARPATSGEFGVLKISAVTWGTFDPRQNKALMPGDEPRPHERVKADDLLISRANTAELVGAAVLVEDDYHRLMLPDKVLRLCLVPNGIDPEYLLFALRSESVRSYFESVATGTSYSMRNLSQPKIERAPVSLPPFLEQKEIVSQIKRFLAKIEDAGNATAKVEEALSNLDQAILKRAFCGELVPQDPSDEPATLLIDRFRSQVAKRVVVPKRRTNKKDKMSKLTIRSLRELIIRLPADRFSFDELRKHAGGDYSTLKSLVFELLGERNPIINQFFDHELRAIRFRRTKA